MRASKRSHVLAVLRDKYALTQKALAKKLRCTKSAVQGIELEKFKLSRKMANRISRKFEVDLKWLLENNKDAPMRTRDGKTLILGKQSPTRSAAAPTASDEIEEEFKQTWEEKLDEYIDGFPNEHRQRVADLVYEWVTRYLKPQKPNQAIKNSP
jgi:transcriptional regulator with XRE-family HTH domain